MRPSQWKAYRPAGQTYHRTSWYPSGLFHADYTDSGHSDAAALLSNRGYSRSTACRNNRIVGLIAFERYDASGNLNAF